MAKLRHIAMQVPDLEKAAAFYEGVFGLRRLKKVEAPIGNAISLSDGVMNLTLLHFPEGTKGGKGGPDWAGLHHFGFVVENEDATEQEIKKHGGEFFMQLPNYPGVDAEKKFKDINGIVFDVSEHGWDQHGRLDARPMSAAGTQERSLSAKLTAAIGGTADLSQS